MIYLIKDLSSESSQEFIKKIPISKKDTKKVDMKIKEMCQALNVTKLKEIKNEFKALSLVSEIQALCKIQLKHSNSFGNINKLLLKPKGTSIYFKLTN